MTGMLELNDRQGFDTETLQVGVGVSSLTETKYKPANEDTAKAALITLEGANIRYWSSSRTLGGVVSPTAEEGHLVKDGGQVGLDSYNSIRHFRYLRVEDGVTKIQVEYYR